jgi:hypothetical protein
MNDESAPFSGRLFTVSPSDQPYPQNEKLQAHLLDQYRLYVEMTDRISARRQTANSYFLTVNTALLSFVGYVTVKDSGSYLWLLGGVVGVVLCYLWYRLICSYRSLNSAKFIVIHAIEKRLPICPYDAEWEAMGRGKDPSLYKPFTYIEAAVPWIFAVLHVFVVIRTISWQYVCGWMQ